MLTLLMMLVNLPMNQLPLPTLPLVMFGMPELQPMHGPPTPGLLMLLMPVPMLPLMLGMVPTDMLLQLGDMVTDSTDTTEKNKQSDTTPKKFNSRLVFTNIITTVQ